MGTRPQHRNHEGDYNTHYEARCHSIMVAANRSVAIWKVYLLRESGRHSHVHITAR